MTKRRHYTQYYTPLSSRAQVLFTLDVFDVHVLQNASTLKKVVFYYFFIGTVSIIIIINSLRKSCDVCEVKNRIKVFQRKLYIYVGSLKRGYAFSAGL